MTKEENEKIAICPNCLRTLVSDLYFASDNHLRHQICFSKLKFKSPMSAQEFS